MTDLDQNSAGTLLCRLAGADVGVLRLAPKARREYIALAIVLLATASMAVLSMTFAMTDGLKVGLALAVLIGLFWGGIILAVDRALVINLKPRGGRWRVLLMILPRILMAALLGLVVSTPLTLRIFSHEISAQMTMDQIAEANSAAQKLANGDLQRLLAAKQADVKKYEDILAGNYTYTSPGLAQAQQEYQAAQADYQAKEQAMEAAYQKWQCELYGVGCSGTSGRVGNGPLAQALEQQYLNRKSEATQAKAVLDTKQAALQTAQQQNKTDGQGALTSAQDDAKKQLAILRPQRDELQSQVQALNDKAQAKPSDGLLAQLVALGHLDDQSGLAELAHLLLAALLFMIELLPVAIKTLTSTGPTTVYERADKFDDDRILKLAAANADREHVKQEQIDKRAIESEDRVARKLQARVEEVVTELAMTAVEEWEQDVRQAAAAQAKPTHAMAGNGAGIGTGNGAGNGGGAWQTQTAPRQPGPYNLPPAGAPTNGTARSHPFAGGMQP